MTKDFKNILIVRTDRIGDVVLTTPCLKALRRRFPEARMSILTSPLTSPLIEGNPYLNDALVDDREQGNAGFGGFLKLVEELKKCHFDLAIIFHTKRRTNLACFLSGIPHRMGYKNNKFGFLLTHPLKDVRHLGLKHESQYCLDVLEAFGIPGQELELWINSCAKEDRGVEEILKRNNISLDKKIVIIHPGASDPSKYWPSYRFAELIDCIDKFYPSQFVLIGEPAIQKIGEAIMAKAQKKILNLIGATSVEQLVSLIKHCDMLISNDSGPVHIAAALKVPVVSIFTRNQPGINPERWHPLGEKSRWIAVPKELNISFAKAQEVDSRYLELIGVNEVFELVDALFKLC